MNRLGRNLVRFALLDTSPITINRSSSPIIQLKSNIFDKFHFINYSSNGKRQNSSKMIDQQRNIGDNMTSIGTERNELSKTASISPASSFAQLSSLDDEKCTSDSGNSNGNSSINSQIYTFALYDALNDICQNNIKYFECDDTEIGQRFLWSFQGIIDHINAIKVKLSKIVQFMHEYDFDDKTPANGYRSFVKAVESGVNHSLKVSKYIAQNRSYLLFRKSMYMKEIEACNHLMASLDSCLIQLLVIRRSSEPGSLFPTTINTAQELFELSSNINQYSFYGRCLGFHYCESMQSVLKFLAIALASFSEAYYRDGNRITKATSSMWTGGKYYWNPELRARRIVSLSQCAGIDFCKAFWSLTEGELMYALPNVFGVKVKVNKLITIPAEPIIIENDHGTMIEIPVPSSHLGPAPVVARLLSSVRRTGMIGERNSKRNMHAPSKNLIFHCHGGGFVAQSSKSHEVYLREWAVRLNAPILSIDYSLAPQAPYPRALEEVFFAYCWALKNAHLLGTTAERIVVVGDSAGANLNLALTLKCIDQNIRRPDGVLAIYCPVKLSFNPSPARVMCVMDTLLPFGFLMRCLKAYVHPGKDQYATTKKEMENMQTDGDKVTDSAHSSMSTTSAVVVVMSDSESEMPTFVHVGSEQCENDYENDRQADENSASMDSSSVWEHIEHDPMYIDDNKSPMSDGTSDTFASASMQNSQTGANTEMMTPDESNAISFEEDSQPITLHNPMNDGMMTMMKTELTPTHTKPIEPRNSTSSSLVDMDSATDQKNDSSTQYVAEFIGRYPTVSKIDENGVPRKLSQNNMTQSEENVLYDEGREAINMQTIPNKIYRAVETAANTVANTFNAITSQAPIKNGMTVHEYGIMRCRLNSVVERNPADEFQFDIPTDPFMSPYYANDEMLKKFPPVKILTVDMDPCLDDCIMFAKRLKSLGNPIGLDVLTGLPHGFLSFVKLSKEAHEGNRVCIKRLAELLDPPNDNQC